MKKPKKPDGIEQLLQVSEECVLPIVNKDGTWRDRPCRCRQKIRRLLWKLFKVRA